MTEKLILVCNDDGIASPGIKALAKAVSELGQVYVVAPDREQSAASHSISLARPLRVHEREERHFAVDGTPTDCAYIAIHHLLPRKPDLLVSGINHGGNLGNDVTYSGTVAAAMEGTLFGVASIAFSQLRASKENLTKNLPFVTKLAAWVLKHGLPADTLLNVNFPPEGDGERYAWTKLGHRLYGEQVDMRVDPRGRKYYWIGGDDIGSDDIKGSDCNAVAENLIAVTPVHLDLTNYDALAALAKQEL